MLILGRHLFSFMYVISHWRFLVLFAYMNAESVCIGVRICYHSCGPMPIWKLELVRARATGAWTEQVPMNGTHEQAMCTYSSTHCLQKVLEIPHKEESASHPTLILLVKMRCRKFENRFELLLYESLKRKPG